MLETKRAESVETKFPAPPPSKTSYHSSSCTNWQAPWPPASVELLVTALGTEGQTAPTVSPVP